MNGSNGDDDRDGDGDRTMLGPVCPKAGDACQKININTKWALTDSIYFQYRYSFNVL